MLVCLKIIDQCTKEIKNNFDFFLNMYFNIRDLNLTCQTDLLSP